MATCCSSASTCRSSPSDRSLQGEQRGEPCFERRHLGRDEQVVEVHVDQLEANVAAARTELDAETLAALAAIFERYPNPSA